MTLNKTSPDILEKCLHALDVIESAGDEPREVINAVASMLDSLAEDGDVPHLHEFAARLRGTEGNLEHAEVIMDEFERWAQQRS